jgi:hypothetical protein
MITDSTSAHAQFTGVRNMLAGLTGLVLLLIGPAVAASTTWDFRGLTAAPMGIIAPSGTSPNALTFTVDGHTVTASSWSDTGSGSTFEGATIDRYWTGLGSCATTELGDCINPVSGDSTHQVDNQDEQEWILFVFDETYNFESLVHSPFGDADRDASYWIGTIDPDQDLTGLTYSDLTGIGFGDRIDTSADFGQGTVTINFDGAVGNAILIGAALGDIDDRMKIASVQASVVPLPPSATLLLTALLGLAWYRKRTGRTDDIGQAAVPA